MITWRGAVAVLGLIVGCGGASPGDTPGGPPDGTRRGDDDGDDHQVVSAPPAEGCPASLDAADGQHCAPDGVIEVQSCDYGGAGSCRCTEQPYCSGAEREPDPVEYYVWVCQRPPPEWREDGCPGALPAAGSACEPVGKRCGYGDCCVTQVDCTADGWGRPGPSMCPP